MPYLDTAEPDVILLDLNFERGATDGAEGFRWLPRILDKDPDAAVVIITAHGGLTIAVEAIKRGATDFVAKPWSNERLVATVRSAAALRASKRATQTERSRAVEIGTPVGDMPLLGQSAAMQRVNSLIERAAPTDANVLILGENGTGKELVARELHRQSRRSGQADGLGRSRRGHRKPVRIRAVRPCRRAPSPTPRPTASAGSRRPMAAPCSSTRSAICRSTSSPSC